MKKPNKKQNPKAKPAEDAGKSGSKIGKIVLPLVLGITSFCTVYFLPSTDLPQVDHGEGVQTSQGNDGHAALDEPPVETSFITLKPFTVSLAGRDHILRLGITLEAPQTEFIDPDDPKLRDAFMGYLSALGLAQVQDPAFMVSLRAQLSRRAKFALGTDTAIQILITDFMVQ